MTYILSFFVCGCICLIAQIIYDNTKLSPGHITSLFVIIGAFLNIGGIYDKLLKISPVGASLPITSFGHSLAHASWQTMTKDGILGGLLGMFNMTAAGINAAIIFAFFMAIIFRPKL